jgi:hypothetical protein
MDPAALPEEFGPHEEATDARRLSAKVPLEQAPSVIAELLEPVAAYAVGIICMLAGTTIVIAATSANDVTRIVSLKFVCVLIPSKYFNVAIFET